jgi:hypothetical protein
MFMSGIHNATKQVNYCSEVKIVSSLLTYKACVYIY